MSWAGLLALMLAAEPVAGAQVDGGAEAALQPPRLRRAAQAVYPEAERLAGRSASVRLLLDVDAEGAVTRAEVVSPPDAPFDASALAAAVQLEFEPAQLDGAPVPARLTYAFHFEATPALAAPDAGAPTLETVVRAIRRSGQGTVAVSAEQGRAVPGALGDALGAVASLPGVARVSTGSSELILWGATANQSRVFVDDVPIPTLLHRGGLRSVLGDAFVSRVEVLPAVHGPERGGFTGGQVRVESAPLDAPGLHGHLAVDPLDASAHVALGADEDAFAAGARVSWLERWLPRVAPSVRQSFPLAGYWDYAAKWRHASPGGALQLSLLGAADALERPLPGATRDPRLLERSQSVFHRASLRLEREDLLALGWVGLDRASLRADFADVFTAQRSEAWRGGLRAERRLRAGPLRLLLGAELEASRTQLLREGTLGLPAREGDATVYGLAPVGVVGADAWEVLQLSAGAFALADLTLLGGALRLTPGLRLEPRVLEGDRLLPASGGSLPVGYGRFELAVEPALSLEATLTPTVSLRASASLDSQPPAPEDLSPVFGSTQLTSSSAAHLVAGGLFSPAPGLQLEALGWAQTGWGLAARSASPAPPLAQALSGRAESRGAGLQLVVRRTARTGLSGWLSYALQRSERRADPAAAWRPLDFDQTHALTAVAAFSTADEWTFSARVRAATGLPRTPVLGAYYAARTGAYEPILGAVGAERLPAFFQVDLHVEKRLTLGRGALSAYLDVLNVSARANAEEWIYSADYSERRELTGLPVLAVLGLRGEL